MDALQPFGFENSGQVVPLEQCEPIITDTYRRFCDGELVSRQDFDQTCLALDTLERVEVAFQNSHVGEDHPQHERLVGLRAHVNEMHSKTQCLVHRDADLLRKIHQRPENKFFRTDNGEIYIQPDDGGLAELCQNQFPCNLYKGFQFSRDIILREPATGTRRPCTLLFFIKHSDQIAFEKLRTTNPEGSWSPYYLYQQHRFHHRSEQQLAFLLGLEDPIRDSLEERKYYSMTSLLNKEARMSCGLSSESITDVEGFLLWYKKLDESNNGRVEEVFDSPPERSAPPQKIHTEPPMSIFRKMLQQIASVIHKIFLAIQSLGNWLVSKFSIVPVS